MLHRGPIRPPVAVPSSWLAQAADGDVDLYMPCVEDELLDDPVDPKHAVFGDPIVGVENVVSDEHGPGRLRPNHYRHQKV